MSPDGPWPVCRKWFATSVRLCQMNRPIIPMKGREAARVMRKMPVHGGFQFLKEQQKYIQHHKIAGQQGEIPMKVERPLHPKPAPGEAERHVGTRSGGTEGL